MPVFSIIVPVYKVEQYLPQCVDSILSQTFRDFELILVDDGSPDNCGTICDRYASEDARIRVIHKENGGLSSARNCGMRAACGEYLLFLDSDDYWDRADALDLILAAFTDNRADVVLLKHRKLDMKTSALSSGDIPGSNEEIAQLPYPQQLEICVSMQLFDTCAWNKAFRRSLMETTDLFFEQGIIGEDIDWAARLALASKKLAIVDKPVHVYRKGRPGAITNSLKLKNLVDTKGSIERCLDYIAGQSHDEVFLNAYYSYVAYRYVIWMAESAVVKDPDKKRLIQKMKAYQFLLKHGGNPKVKLANLLRRMVGFDLCRMILGFYLSRK